MLGLYALAKKKITRLQNSCSVHTLGDLQKPLLVMMTNVIIFASTYYFNEMQ